MSRTGARLYGHSAALEAAGSQTQQDLVDTPYAESSATGQAYQTLLAPVDRERTDLSADPLWDFTDATVSSLDDFTATYADCTWDNTFLSRPRTVHVPEYEACLIAGPGPAQARVARRPAPWTRRSTGIRCRSAPIPRPASRSSSSSAGSRSGWMSGAGRRRPVSRRCDERVMDGFCRSTTTCTSNPDADCVPVTGGELCGGELVAPPYLGETGNEPWEQFSGIGAACMQVSVALDCTSFNDGRMDCWTDPDGVTHCPENPGDLDNCAVLDANPHCRRVSRQCAEDATGKSRGLLRRSGRLRLRHRSGDRRHRAHLGARLRRGDPLSGRRLRERSSPNPRTTSTRRWRRSMPPRWCPSMPTARRGAAQVFKGEARGVQARGRRDRQLLRAPRAGFRWGSICN